MPTPIITGPNGRLTWTGIRNTIQVVATIILIVGAGFTVKAHMDDQNVHLSRPQGLALENIVTDGFPVSAIDKVIMNDRIKTLEIKFDAIQAQLERIERKLDERLRRTN